MFFTSAYVCLGVGKTTVEVIAEEILTILSPKLVG